MTELAPAANALATPMSNALQVCYDLRQHITALQSRESGWLIERQAGRNGPIYMRLIYYSDEAAKPIWVEDANAALRFSRKQDGEDVARLFQRECCLASVTEHVFCALTAAAPEPKGK